MEFQQIKYFITVAEMEHFSNAAQELNISQSALSLTIQRLSNELGVPLFEKNGRNVKLTNYGKIFLEKIKPAYEQILDATNSVHIQKQKDFDKVIIYGPSMFSFRNLMQQVRIFCPSIGIKNVALPYTEALQALQSEKGDIAIFMVPPDFEINTTIFECERFTRDDAAIIMSENHPLAKFDVLTIDQLSAEPFATYSDGINIRPVLDSYFQNNHTFFNVAYESDLVFDQIALVRSNTALSVVPRRLLEMHDMHKIVTKSIEPLIEYDVCVVRSKNKKMKPALRQIHDSIINYFKNEENDPKLYKTVREQKAEKN